MSIKLRVLVIAPLVDVPTVTSNLLALDILSYISNITFQDKIDVDLLWGLAANRTLFNTKASLKKYDLVIYIGHGKENKLHGTHMFWSIINEKNIHKLKGSIILTMACLSAKELGKIAIQKGVKAYIGATDIIYANFPEKERNYLSDWRDEFGSYFKAVIDGRSVGEAYNTFQKRMDHYIKLYRKEGDYRNYDWYEEAARHNRNVSILLGDPNARLY